MCSFEGALPFVALAVISGSKWEEMLRQRADALLPGSSRPERNTSEQREED